MLRGGIGFDVAAARLVRKCKRDWHRASQSSRWTATINMLILETYETPVKTVSVAEPIAPACTISARASVVQLLVRQSTTTTEGLPRCPSTRSRVHLGRRLLVSRERPLVVARRLLDASAYA